MKKYFMEFKIQLDIQRTTDIEQGYPLMKFHI